VWSSDLVIRLQKRSRGKKGGREGGREGGKEGEKERRTATQNSFMLACNISTRSALRASSTTLA
jgi:hypothetical protein